MARAQLSRLGEPAALAAASLLTLLALALLFGLPADPFEFNYASEPALWPLPFAPFNGFTRPQLFSHAVRLVLLTPAAVLVGYALRRRAHGWRLPSLSPTAMAVLAAAAVLAIAVGVLRGVPIVDDEATYRMQAATLADGRLLDPPVPAAAEWHREPFTVHVERGITGKYLFGQPLVLAPGEWVGFAPLLHLLLAALTVFAVHRACIRTVSPRAAWLAAALVALSPSLLFTSATMLSQTPALAALAVAIWMLSRGGWRGGLIAGAVLGLGVAIRPQVVVPAGVALVLISLRGNLRFWGAAAIAAAPWGVLLLLYVQQVFGGVEAFPKEVYGFGKAGTLPYEHTPFRGLLQALVVLVRFNGWALGWPISLAGPIAWFWAGRPGWAAVRPWFAVAVATFVFQLGYYSTGISETGSAYHHAAVPFFAVSAAMALDRLAASGFVRATVVALCILGTGTFVAEHALRLRRLTDRIAAPLQSAAFEPPAIVFVESSWEGGIHQGWVQGVPWRVRRPSSPLVFFPRPRPEAIAPLRALWPDRRCYYVLRADRRASYRVDDCEEMAARGADFDAREPPLE